MSERTIGERTMDERTVNERTSSEYTWPRALRLVHWVSAVLVIGLLALGAYMVQLVADPAERFDLTQTHKSIGVVVLALTLVRLCLRVVTTAPKRERAPLLLAAKATHAGLYALLLLMPLSGWLMTTTTPVRVPTVVLGLFALPYPLTPDLATYRLAHAIHVTAAISLALLVFLHSAAAIAHALRGRRRVRRDGATVRNPGALTP
jgi:cytochrome b561